MVFQRFALKIDESEMRRQRFDAGNDGRPRQPFQQSRLDETRLFQHRLPPATEDFPITFENRSQQQNARLALSTVWHGLSSAAIPAHFVIPAQVRDDGT